MKWGSKEKKGSLEWTSWFVGVKRNWLRVVSGSWQSNYDRSQNGGNKFDCSLLMKSAACRRSLLKMKLLYGVQNNPNRCTFSSMPLCVPGIFFWKVSVNWISCEGWKRSSCNKVLIVICTEIYWKNSVGVFRTFTANLSSKMHHKVLVKTCYFVQSPWKVLKLHF